MDEKTPRECMTTVGELIKILKKENPDRVVIMSKDGEGNDFSPFTAIGRSAYDPDNTDNTYHQIGIEELTDELKEQGYTEEDLVEGGIPALVLWPIN